MLHLILAGGWRRSHRPQGLIHQRSFYHQFKIVDERGGGICARDLPAMRSVWDTQPA